MEGGYWVEEGWRKGGEEGSNRRDEVKGRVLGEN